MMNAIGLVAFALVGAAKAIHERFDLFSIVVVGLATAFAGGATRDVLVNRVPLALSSLSEIALGLFGVSLAIGVSAVLESPDDHPVTLVSDAVGLAAFATAGSIVPADTGLSGFGIVAVATRRSTRPVEARVRTSYWIGRRSFSSPTSTRAVPC